MAPAGTPEGCDEMVSAVTLSTTSHAINRDKTFIWCSFAWFRGSCLSISSLVQVGKAAQFVLLAIQGGTHMTVPPEHISPKNRVTTKRHPAPSHPES
jgi:hypothetical protein